MISVKERVNLFFLFCFLCTLNIFFVKIILGDNVDYKKIAYILMTIGFVFIMSGSVSSFVLGLQQDKRETYKRVGVVNDVFEEFSTMTSLFENSRDELYTVFLSNVYYDTMYDDDEVIKNKLKEYEKLVDDISIKVKSLDKMCSNMYYPSSEANNKCENYKLIYEQVNNYFVGDIKTYNLNVSKYNLYQKNNGSTLEISKYSTKKKYIDYNKDKKYDGKEE